MIHGYPALSKNIKHCPGASNVIQDCPTLFSLLAPDLHYLFTLWNCCSYFWSTVSVLMSTMSVFCLSASTLHNLSVLPWSSDWNAHPRWNAQFMSKTAQGSLYIVQKKHISSKKNHLTGRGKLQQGFIFLDSPWTGDRSCILGQPLNISKFGYLQVSLEGSYTAT